MICAEDVNMNKGITIIICTYNGRERLGKTLSHIAALNIPLDIKIELILADNNSDDGSTEFAIKEWSHFNNTEISFKVLCETKPGKLYALQKAIKNAEHEYLIICDDDNWLAKDYLIKVFNNFEQMPAIGAIGGLGIAVTDIPVLPTWFDDYHYAFAVGSQAKKKGILKREKVLWGAGFATKKSLYQAMYQHHPSLLPKSEFNILSAEDTEYCLRLIIKGYQLYYDDEMIYHHFIPGAKLSKTFLEEKLLKGFNNSRQILGRYYPAVKVARAKNKPHVWLYLFLTSCLRAIFFKNRRKVKAKDTLFYLLPFWKRSDSFATEIKKFINDNRIPLAKK